MVLAYFPADTESPIALINRSVALNPSFARGWYISGMMHWWSGQPALAIEHLEKALRLCPRGRIGFVHSNIGICYALMGRFEQAIAKLLLEIQSEPDYVIAYRWLASCYGNMGRAEEAKAVMVAIRKLSPGAATANWIGPSYGPLRTPEHREIFLSGLRVAAGIQTS